MKQLKSVVPVGLMSIIVVLSIALLWRPASGQDKSPKSVVKWEYKKLRYLEREAKKESLEAMLNKLGEDGWEYAGSLTADLSGQAFGGGGGKGGAGFPLSGNYTIILKRSKQ